MGGRDQLDVVLTIPTGGAMAHECERMPLRQAMTAGRGACHLPKISLMGSRFSARTIARLARKRVVLRPSGQRAGQRRTEEPRKNSIMRVHPPRTKAPSSIYDPGNISKTFMPNSERSDHVLSIFCILSYSRDCVTMESHPVRSWCQKGAVVLAFPFWRYAEVAGLVETAFSLR